MSVTLPELHDMKIRGVKIVGVVAWDYHAAQIADRVGVDIVSVGDSVGVNLWGHTNPLEVTLEEMLTVAKAVRHGVRRALVVCDFPYGPLQEGPQAAVRAAIRLIKEAGVDVVKLDGAAEHLEAVSSITRAGIPVFAQFGITPQTSSRFGISYATMAQPGTHVPAEMADQLVRQARDLEAAGASLLDFQNSGPVVGPQVVKAVSIPVLGGFGGGPWLDGRMRMLNAAIGYSVDAIDDPKDAYANVGTEILQAVQAYADDVRSGRQVKGGIPVTTPSEKG